MFWDRHSSYLPLVEETTGGKHEGCKEWCGRMLRKEGCLPSVLVLVVVLGLAGAARVLYTSELDCQPRQIHLSLGSSPYEIVVSWTTTSGPCDSSVKLWKPDEDTQGNSATEFTGWRIKLNQQDMCEAPAAQRAFRLNQHHATLSGLEPDTLYAYSIVESDKTFSFYTAPRAGPRSNFNFIAFGDMGVDTKSKRTEKCAGATATLQALKREVDSQSRSSRPDFIMHAGDLSYANGHPGVWDEFMDAIEPIASTTPYMVAIGNHEYDYRHGTDRDPSGASPYHPNWGNFGDDSQGECGAQAATRFRMPQRNSNSNSATIDNSPFWYGFEHGNAYFIALSTEHDVTPGSQQYKWLQAELQAVDRCTTPWLIITMHRPMYVVYPHKDNRVVGQHLADSIEDLLRTYQVDLVISGHVHSYVRSCRVYKQRCQESNRGATSNSSIEGALGVERRSGWGTVHLTIGTGGHELSDVDDEQLEWVAAAIQRFGYGRFSVRETELKFEFVSSESGAVLDWATLQSNWTSSAQCQRHAQEVVRRQ